MLKDQDVQSTLPAKDLNRARDFYEKKLGLTIESEDEGGIFFRSGKTHFFVFVSTGEPSGNHTQMGWPVADIEAEVNALKEKEVQFEEYDLPEFKTENSIVTFGESKSAWFHDSEGNLLAITQRPRAASVGSRSSNGSAGE